MDAWGLAKEANSDWENYEEILSLPISEPPKPDTATVLVDFATEAEKPKTYVEPEVKVFEERKKEGFSMAPPVDVHEPGFRSDMYEAIIGYFKKKRAERDKLDSIKEKIGWTR